jgi:hypothetical protein
MHKCNCYPWYLTQIPRDNLTICDAFGMRCYKEFVLDAKKDDMFMTECLPACISTKYSSYLYGQRGSDSRSKTDPLRQNITTYFETGIDSIVNRLLINASVESYEKLGWSLISIININFEDPEATVVTKDAKVTFSDMLGTIGGTFGIFLGLSIVGLVDMFLEMYEWFQSMIKPIGRQH